ncbi:hypothetical protein ACHAQH_001322 [Verticillium albo-atrum]
MSGVENPMSTPSAKPAASKRTILMAGLPSDAYGLEEVASLPTTAVSCLWLHHPRTRRKEDMADFAMRIVSDWHQRRRDNRSSRGLVAVVFDQRNHGGRLVEERANNAWKKGNATHAIDMAGAITGMVSDTRGLIDLVDGYLGHELGSMKDGDWDAEIDQHLLLGVSLGGHSAWQALFDEPRIRAAVVIIGCPDFMALMTNRAKNAGLSSYTADDKGASFLGSKDFPKDLVRACAKHDPKAILFGTGMIPKKPSEEEQQQLKAVLNDRLKGKKFLVCSGGDDKLVPYSQSKRFLEFLESATKTWYKEGGIVLENKVYEGIGHAFSEDMVEDAVRFLLDEVASAPGGERGPRAGSEEGRSKI